MSLKLLTPQTIRKYTALSTDLKPKLGINDAGAELYETDTDIKFIWFGSKWVQHSKEGILTYPDLIHETDTVIVLNEISNKLSILIEYEAILHKIEL